MNQRILSLVSFVRFIIPDRDLKCYYAFEIKLMKINLICFSIFQNVRINIIKDYTDRRDKFSLSGGISFNDLTIDEMGGNAVIKNGNQILAIVENVSANVIRSNDFI